MEALNSLWDSAGEKGEAIKSKKPEEAGDFPKTRGAEKYPARGLQEWERMQVGPWNPAWRPFSKVKKPCAGGEE